MAAPRRRQAWYTTRNDWLQGPMFWPVHWLGWLWAAIFFAVLGLLWTHVLAPGLTAGQEMMATVGVVAAFLVVVYLRCDWGE